MQHLPSKPTEPGLYYVQSYSLRTWPEIGYFPNSIELVNVRLDTKPRSRDINNKVLMVSYQAFGDAQGGREELSKIPDTVQWYGPVEFPLPTFPAPTITPEIQAELDRKHAEKKRYEESQQPQS